jgi:hypothetical protein
MNTRKIIQIAAAFMAAGFTTSACAQPAGRGMPVEARKAIHTLFNHHDQVVRRLTLTDRGYVATTTSTNPVVAEAIQRHVGQMGERLKAGLMVRRWDPAFAEYASNYDRIEHQFEPVDGGISATVTGKTSDAVKIAQNHAKVIVDFVNHGWEAHDRAHPAALTVEARSETDPAPAAKSTAMACCLTGKNGALDQPDVGCGAACRARSAGK